MIKTRGMINQCISFKNKDEKNSFKKNYFLKHNIYKKFREGKKFTYSDKKANFRLVLSKILKKKYLYLKDINALDNNLENLHKYIDNKLINYESSSETNQIIRDFYDTEPSFKKEYEKFLKNVIKPIIKEPFYYQKTPTIRFIFPNEKTFDWKPSIHTDIMLGHPIEEINIWVPITKAEGTNSMGLASLKDSLKIINNENFEFNKFAYKNQKNISFHKRNLKKLKPLFMRKNSFIIFDPRRLHATLKNKTNSTRISFDIRIITKSVFNKLEKLYIGTGRRKMKFIPNHYYSKKVIS